MAATVPRLEAGDTRQFTVVYSTPPGTTPGLSITTGSGGGVLVTSLVATASSTLAFYAFVTLPASPGVYVATWIASYAAGPVVTRDLFQVIQTLPLG